MPETKMNQFVSLYTVRGANEEVTGCRGCEFYGVLIISQKSSIKMKENEKL